MGEGSISLSLGTGDILVARKRKNLRVVIVALIVAAIALVAMRRLIPDLETFRTLLETLGTIPLPAYLLIYMVATLAMAPLALMIASGGVILGWNGLWVVTLGCLLGASIAFWVARRLLFQSVHAWLEGDARLRVLQGLLQKDGFKLVVLVRLSPILPFSGFNYAAGAMPIRYGKFLVASALGLIPRVSLGIFVAMGARDLIDAGDLSQLRPEQMLSYAVSLIATLLVLALVTKMARRALQESGVVEEDDL